MKPFIIVFNHNPKARISDAELIGPSDKALPNGLKALGLDKDSQVNK